jgi:hypothetical protein
MTDNVIPPPLEPLNANGEAGQPGRSGRQDRDVGTWTSEVRV